MFTFFFTGQLVLFLKIFFHFTPYLQFTIVLCNDQPDPLSLQVIADKQTCSTVKNTMSIMTFHHSAAHTFGLQELEHDTLCTEPE